MAATFNPELITDLDRMRDALGDVDVENPIAPDETYLARLVESGGKWRLAGAAMARSFASRAINKPTSFTAVGEMSTGWANRANEWLRIAAALEAENARLDEPSRSGLWFAAPERTDLDEQGGEYSRRLRKV